MPACELSLMVTHGISSQTSLNLPGFSLTCLLLPREGDKYSPKRIIDLLDAHASSPGWKFMANTEPGVPGPAGGTPSETPVKSGGAPVARESMSSALLQDCIKFYHQLSTLGSSRRPLRLLARTLLMQNPKSLATTRLPVTATADYV